MRTERRFPQVSRMSSPGQRRNDDIFYPRSGDSPSEEWSMAVGWRPVPPLSLVAIAPGRPCQASLRHNPAFTERDCGA